MRPARPLRPLLACLALALATTALRAAPPDPLRLVPEQADVCIEVKQPARLVQTVLGLDLLKEARNLDAVAEFLDSTNLRRFQQLVAYYEKELGAPWPDLVERLAGGGVVLAVKFAPNPAPALLVLQGKDKELTGKFFHLALEVAEQELARQELPAHIEKGSHRGVETAHLGKDFCAAVADTALLVSNNQDALHAAIDLHLDGPAKSLAGSKSLAEAHKLLPAEPLLRAWVNLEPVHKLEQAKEAFHIPRDSFLLTILFSGYLDVAGRSPFAAAGVYGNPDGFLATVRLPRGREGMPEVLSTHIPPPGEPGSRPLLEPKGVLYSESFYLDVGKFWDQRAKLFPDKQVKSFEEADANSGRFPFSTLKLSKALTQAGAYHRVVVARQSDTGYKITPKVTIPAFAVVVEERDPEGFGKAAEAGARAAALFGGAQFGLQLAEEKHGKHTLVGYRFSEKTRVPADTSDIRFNFSPCFVNVGNQFVASSTLELGRALVDILEKETSDPTPHGAAATVRTRLYGGGGAEFLHGLEDVLLTQTILDRALPPEQARGEVKALLDLVRRLGTLDVETAYGARDFRYDVRLRMEKR
jgi:hypothetical protein